MRGLSGAGIGAGSWIRVSWPGMLLLQDDPECVSRNGKKDLGFTWEVELIELTEALELKAEEDGHVVGRFKGLAEHEGTIHNL